MVTNNVLLHEPPKHFVGGGSAKTMPGIEVKSIKNNFSQNMLKWNCYCIDIRFK